MVLIVCAAAQSDPTLESNIPHTGQRCCARMAKDQMSHKGCRVPGAARSPRRPHGDCLCHCCLARSRVHVVPARPSRPKVRQPGIADSPVARFRGDGTLRSWQRHRGADRWTRRIQIDRTLHSVDLQADKEFDLTPAMETAGVAHPTGGRIENSAGQRRALVQEQRRRCPSRTGGLTSTVIVPPDSLTDVTVGRKIKGAMFDSEPRWGPMAYRTALDGPPARPETRLQGRCRNCRRLQFHSDIRWRDRCCWRDEGATDSELRDFAKQALAGQCQRAPDNDWCLWILKHLYAIDMRPGDRHHSQIAALHWQR